MFCKANSDQSLGARHSRISATGSQVFTSVRAWNMTLMPFYWIRRYCAFVGSAPRRFVLRAVWNPLFFVYSVLLRNEYEWWTVRNVEESGRGLHESSMDGLRGIPGQPDIRRHSNRIPPKSESDALPPCWFSWLLLFGSQLAKKKKKKRFKICLGRTTVKPV
jgi:hypothetical protein